MILIFTGNSIEIAITFLVTLDRMESRVSSYLKKWFWQFNLITCCLLNWAHGCYADLPTAVLEYQVKASFLFTMSKFVTYPEEAFSSADAAFNMCVLGEDPFQRVLDIGAKESNTNIIQGHPVKVIYSQRLEEIQVCHILFVSESEKNRLPNIITYLEKRPILTVSDIKDFLVHGGMIEFYTEESKIKFCINLNRIIEARLNIGSQVLRLAKLKDCKPADK